MADLSREGTGALGDVDTAAIAELLFFAYRDFTGGPDRMLADLGLGRAHHRVIHFVDRNPGLTVAELLDILKITKQSLARVLKALVDAGLVHQSPGEADRRQRRLHTTPSGHDLALRLHQVQAARIARALADMPPAAVDAVRGFLIAMVDERDRRASERLIGGKVDD